MRFEQSKYSELLPHSKIEFSFGNYYLCDHFAIAEIHEGIHFDWEKMLEVIGVLLDYYGNGIKISYISNRVHSYSSEPQFWHKFHKEFNFIVASAAVVYTSFAHINAALEKQFSQISFKCCDDLGEAMSWVKHLNAFNQD